MKNRVKNASHYPTKQVQRLADGGPVRGGNSLRNMMGNWQRAVRSGNTGPIFVNPRFGDKRAIANNAFAAFLFDGMRPPQRKKKAPTDG